VHGSIYEFQRLPANPGEARRPQLRRVLPRVSAVPLVGIIRNPRAHRNLGHPAEMEDCSNIFVATPTSREDLQDCLAGFAERGIDYLAIDGGDGTVRDVLTCGAAVFGEHWPRILILPRGKTNALAVDLGLPKNWSLGAALGAARHGSLAMRRPLVVRKHREDWRQPSASVHGFVFGAGAFTLATEAGQEAHRRGAFNSFAVGLSILWAILQTLFGRADNLWRRGTPMRIADCAFAEELPHTGRGDPERRYLAFATTFERLPLGLKPFGRSPGPGVKMAVLDSPVRWIMLLLPAIMFGWFGERLANRGVHHLASESLEVEVGGPFILDGEVFPAGHYVLEEGPEIAFVVP
jgi:diacylglycerol kinase (ATP)